MMADREIDNRQLHELTGLHLGTISKLRNKKPARLDTQTLDSLCKALNCEPGDLLRFIPDDEGT
ncbi:helix-turn-helix domain-containing protein [Acaryochloris marina NIES-2412]|uniref:helix-turn-helix domain-containing protein n=1 Tax=Acaryochloris marina TaxID=155978 RepID=UPI004058F0C6